MTIYHLVSKDMGDNVLLVGVESEAESRLPSF
jgi:hypothetical protein